MRQKNTVGAFPSVNKYSQVSDHMFHVGDFYTIVDSLMHFILCATTITTTYICHLLFKFTS